MLYISLNLLFVEEPLEGEELGVGGGGQGEVAVELDSLAGDCPSRGVNPNFKSQIPVCANVSVFPGHFLFKNHDCPQ